MREELEADKTSRKKVWQREQEEYEYSLKTRRAREGEEYASRREALMAKLAEERVQQEKALAERERAVAAREREFSELSARVENLEAELERAVAQAREEATRQAEEKARHQAELIAKDVAGNEKLLQQRIQTLDLMLKEQGARTEQFQAELRDSTIKVRDIALKAIEGASGAAALTKVSEIALQQAKGRGEMA